MVKTELETKLAHVLKRVNNIDGVSGTIVVDNQSSVLYANLDSTDEETIFGSMANVISSSGEKLLNLSDQGELDKVLVESQKGNAFFIGLHNSILFILADKSANIGLINLNAKKVSELINDLDEIKAIPDLIEETPTETPTETETPTPEETPKETPTETETPTPEETPTETETPTPEETPKETPTEPETPTPEETPKETPTETPTETPKETPTETETPTPEETPTETETPKETTPGLPQVKRLNIADLKKRTSKTSETTPTPEETPTETETPTPEETPTETETPKEEPTNPIESSTSDVDTEKVIEIYEAIMYEMSMGASKIMGPAPAKGMLKTSLPYEQNKDILDGVEVKDNSSLDFDKVRENLEKIPAENRSQATIDGFSEIIDAITEKYGKVMGYGAFRGMIRPEFKKIYAKYGETMEKLGIKEKMHKELQELLS